MLANIPGWGLLTRQADPARTASELYGRLVAQARATPFYAELGVPDTPEGRLELLLLHMVLMLRRLRRDGTEANPLAQALSETFVTDIDDCLREMGVSDLSVAKKVKKAAAALFDRSRDFGARLDAADRQGLADLLIRHLDIGGDGPAVAGHGDRIAGYAIASENALAAAPTAEILAGGFAFPAL